MTSFDCTLEEFKQGVAEFAKAAPTCERDSLENGLKAVNLMYLGLPVDKLTLTLSQGYLRFAHKAYMDRDVVLQFGHNPLARLMNQVRS